MVNRFALAEASQNFGFFVAVLNREKDRHRTAYHFFGRISIDSLGAGVPGLHNAIDRLADDGIFRR